MSLIAHDNSNIIVRMFHWWNEAFRDPDGFRAEAFSRYYTDDGRLIVNGNLRGCGPAELAEHYRRLQAAFNDIQMELPVREAFSVPGRAFVYCVTRARSGHEESREEAMAYAEVRDGKMALLRVIGHKA